MLGTNHGAEEAWFARTLGAGSWAMTNRTFCNQCQRETNHSVLHCQGNDRSEGSGQDPRMIREEWRLLRCMGCDSIQVYMTEERPNLKPSRCFYYPPKQPRRLPPWCNLLSGELQRLIAEIYSALPADCLTLAVMGARTLIDTLLTEKLGDVGGFRQKLDAAVTAGVLTKEARDIVAAAVEVGHAASHRGFAPTHQQVLLVLDIVEHFLQGSYVLQDTSSRLSSSVPSRGSQK